MCNGKTKPECYRYRIFGLPLMKVEVVKKIKEGTHLYLYDFDLKLLYGTYKATSDGELDLEPIAFKGKFPAQVRFKNSKDCSPLHESRFRTAIIDNYQAGGKFKQELNNKQVRALNQMFHPISSASHHHQREVARTGSYPSPIREEGSRTRPQECVYLPDEHVFQHHEDSYYLAEAHEPYMPEKSFLPSHDLYSRHGVPQPHKPVPRDQFAEYGSVYRMSQLLKERERDIVSHSNYVDETYDRDLPTALPSHFKLRSQASASYQPYYHQVTTHHDHNQWDPDSLKRPLPSSSNRANLPFYSHLPYTGAGRHY